MTTMRHESWRLKGLGSCEPPRYNLHLSPGVYNLHEGQLWGPGKSARRQNRREVRFSVGNPASRRKVLVQGGTGRGLPEREVSNLRGIAADVQPRADPALRLKPFKHGIAITERMHMLIGASGLPERGVAELQARQVNWQGFSVDLPTGHNINQIFEAIDERCLYTKSHK